ncbi:hypothetical protein H634G_10166 [Metarhizium anisopliae BRIP 53293]|uniref:Uncharacterized protein n=1 Tax=Metarhizium anisopliae BRIP 53293 TaxID=1291518 RepID=A0A0D9NLB6_METAN|nr:hypothetical protein H634G_10166 [Metarhizium anisopliae BRIP 53293]KJK90852.1 hypothetical protein H633G_05274 [Metarhizium anisopliae BRIP 53284]
MSIPSTSQLFEAGLRNSPSQSGFLDSLVKQQLEIASRDMEMNTPPPLSSDSEDLVSDLGEYFTRTAAIWAQLTQRLIKGPHIIQASFRAHERSRAESRMSDLAELAKIDMGLSKLRQIGDLSDRFSREVQEVWWPHVSMMNGGGQEVLQTSISPFCDNKISSISESVSLAHGPDSAHFTSRKLLPDKSQLSHAGISGDGSGSEDSSDDDEQFQSIDMEALRQRGKGVYFCPKGMKCDKGGVDKDGNLVVFDRNSSFAYVSLLIRCSTREASPIP